MVFLGQGIFYFNVLLLISLVVFIPAASVQRAVERAAQFMVSIAAPKTPALSPREF